MIRSKKKGKKGGSHAGSAGGEDESIHALGVDILDADAGADGDDFSELDTGGAPEGKDRHFEFTDSAAMMRLTRMLVFCQVLSIMIDNPGVQLPIFFRIVNRGVLYYLGRFYSRIIIDFCYGFQIFVAIVGGDSSMLPTLPKTIKVEEPSLPNAPSAPDAPSTGSLPGGGGVGRRFLEKWWNNNTSSSRSLSASDYVQAPPAPARISAKADFLSPRVWHSVQTYSHFFLSAFFAIMAVVFLLLVWEIRDYSDRKEVREWLREFVADGWWRRGLLQMSLSLCKCCFAMLAFSFGLFAVARELNVNSLPEDTVVGCSLAIVASILLTHWVVGYLSIRSSEAAFVRYVSQNVGYTSNIIIKRVVKAKVDIALLFTFILYMPALHIFMQSFFPIMDWNQTLAQSFRKTINFYVPCYYMAFPPYSDVKLDAKEVCPLNSQTSTKQPQRARGFYRDLTILPCDSYLGVCIFVTGVFFFCFLAVTYFWLWLSLIQGATYEFQNSRFVAPLKTLLSILKESKDDYNRKFNIVERTFLELVYEISSQAKFCVQALRFLVETPAGVLKWVMGGLFVLIRVAVSPVTGVLSGCFSLCCESLTVEGRRRALRDAARLKAREKAKYKELTGEDFVFEGEGEGDENDQEEDMVIRPIPQIIADSMTYCIVHYNPLTLLFIGITFSFNAIYMYCYARNTVVAEIKVQINVIINGVFACIFRLFEEKDGEEGDSANVGLIAMGGAKGDWRVQLSVVAKRAAIEGLNIRVRAALARARTEFVSDHSLTISVFDRVIDSSGLFMLISQYKYNRLWFTILIWFEMTLYAVVGAVSNYYVDWQTRIQYFIAICCVFGALTYLIRPFTEDCDRWFDFSGRLMIVVTCAGILYCHANPPAKPITTPARMYDAAASSPYLTSGAALNPFTLANLVDVVISLYMYFFIIYIVNFIGVFSVASRKIQGWTLAMHDRVLDFLIGRLEERKIGAENMYTGLMVVQQWDDIIREQRRSALIPWPDVRPPDLIPTSAKLIEVKWASFFNLNVTNLRSSLGLTLLHTAMCNADSEVARWIIHLYPELLNAEDFQRDTPVFIALKECAFLLVKFSKQNGGILEDGTSYRDEEFLSYYREIEQYREEAADFGEFIKEASESKTLDAIEVRYLRENGALVETSTTDKADYTPSFRIFKSKLGKYASQDEIEAEKAARAKFEEENKQYAGTEKDEDLTPEEQEEKRKQKARAEAKALAAERLSLYRKRFPEDDFQDNCESGQMAAWKILGLDVPDANLFIDPATAKFRDLNFGEGEQGFAKRQAVEESLDARYVVQSFNKTPIFAETVKVPRTGANVEPAPLPEDHPMNDAMKDWDFVRRKGRGAKNHNRSTLARMTDIKEMLSAVGASSGTAVSLAERLSYERDVRYKLCKFAEILLSPEIMENTKVMKWDLQSYKEFNKMASKDQGRLAQNLAMACAMNPPPGFTRISEWTMGFSLNVFDEYQEDRGQEDPVTAAALVMGDLLPKQQHRGSRAPGKGPRNHGDLDYNKIGRMDSQSPALSDRTIHYLAECVVCCSSRLSLSDCELSVFGRFGWRAIVRALRRNNCTFIMPSIFVGTKEINVTHLDLSRNELDCGDAVLLADVLLYKQSMVVLDLSYNRIGSRGLIRMCKAMKGHENIAILKMQHNRIGPVAGRELGVLLKNNNSLRAIDLSHNRLGELVRFPTLLNRERILSAARDIFQGLRHNKSLESLDLSYNHLGPKLGECIPSAIMRHPTLNSLYLSGNDIGPVRGPLLLFALAGEPGGVSKIEEKERAEEECRQMIKMGIDPVEEMRSRQKKKEEEEEEAAKMIADSPDTKKKKKGKGKKKSTGDDGGAEGVEEDANGGLPVPCRLVVLHLADNQLGAMAGYGAAALSINSKTLTSLDISGNSLGFRGGLAFADGLERCYGLLPRDPDKLTLHKLDEMKYEERDPPPRPLIYTNLVNLNVSRNGMGPKGCQGLMYCMAASNCTLTSVDVSDNPIGFSIENGGDATLLGIDLRTAIASSQTITSFNISRTSLLPVDMVPILGAIAKNELFRTLEIMDMALDEPSCLQLANGLSHCHSLRRFSIRNAKIGARGALIIMNRVKTWGRHIYDLDLSGNDIGPIAMIPLGEMLESDRCAFKTLNLANNGMVDEGARYIIKGLKGNASVTDLDLGENGITESSAERLADVARGLWRDGHKINDCFIKKIILSDNNFGAAGCRLLVRAFTAENFQHLEMANCGAGYSTAKIVAENVREVATHWRVLDMRGNNLGRQGLNLIFWGLRQNRSLRVLLLGDNRAGPMFGSDDDALLRHGVALQRALRANVVLRDLDLSYNGIDSQGGVNLFEALLENYTIRRVNMRGNVLDDDVQEALANLFRYNDIIEELDLGENKMGYQCCLSIAEGIECNRALKILRVDYNNLSSAGNMCLDAFVRCISMNTSLRVLIMDGNKLGSEWGVQLADALARNNTLVKVSLRDSRFDSRAGLMLLNAYIYNSLLMELALSADEVGEEVWVRFKQEFAKKRAYVDPASEVNNETSVEDFGAAFCLKYFGLD